MTSYSELIAQLENKFSEIFDILQPLQTDVINAAYYASVAGEIEAHSHFENLDFYLDSARKNLVIAETMIYRAQDEANK